MMDQLLVEIDVESGELSRLFSVARGMEGPAEPGTQAAMDHSATENVQACSPTWAEPSADGASVFVTCNAAREVLEIAVEDWRVVRRFSTGESPYNLRATPDGRFLLVTLRNRTDPALEIYDLASGRQTARVPATTTLVHGVAVSPDSRYAFVSVEGVGAEPGKVDIIDLAAARRVASVAVGQQATGIAVTR
jgi:DNA-binding beta-propeller fold protein YncE